MDTMAILEELRTKAMHDTTLKEKLLATRRDPDPLGAFCKCCQQLGYPLYEMDLVTVGEDFYAAMKRSTNGGGENSPMMEGQDDFYELFFASLT